MKPGGRLAVISFHSLEDRIAKGHFHDVSFDEMDENNDFEDETLDKTSIKRNQGKKIRLSSKRKFRLNSEYVLHESGSLIKKLWTPLSRKVITPSDEEIERNPRSRSARLRIGIKN